MEAPSSSTLPMDSGPKSLCLLEPGEDDTSSPLWPRQSNSSSQATGPPKIKPNRPRDSHISPSLALHGRARKLSIDDLCTHMIEGVKRFRTHGYTYPRTRIRAWAAILFRGCAQTQTFVRRPMCEDYERVLASNCSPLPVRHHADRMIGLLARAARNASRAVMPCSRPVAMTLAAAA